MEVASALEVALSVPGCVDAVAVPPLVVVGDPLPASAPELDAELEPESPPHAEEATMATWIHRDMSNPGCKRHAQALRDPAEGIF